MGPKRFIIFLLMVVVALALCAVGLTVVDLTNEAEAQKRAPLVCVSDEGLRTKATAGCPLYDNRGWSRSYKHHVSADVRVLP